MEREQNKLPPGAGKSSMDLIDRAMLFAELNIAKGSVLLDMGCGRGNYALAAAEIMGGQGTIYAVDLWEEGILSLETEARVRGFGNIKAFVGDIGKRIPLEKESVDLCWMATVLHDLVEFDVARGALEEITRVLKPRGVLAVIEFKKMDGPPGPPIHIRLTPQEVEGMLLPFGFERMKSVELGPYNYMILFSFYGAARV